MVLPLGLSHGGGECGPNLATADACWEEEEGGRQNELPRDERGELTAMERGKCCERRRQQQQQDTTNEEAEA